MKKDPELEALIAEAMADGLAPEGADAADRSDSRFKQFQKMSGAMRVAHFNAPGDLVDAVKALMPEPERRRIWAKLVGGSLSPAGARAAESDSFQLVFEAEGKRARLMYTRDAKGWEVAGQAPKGLSAERGGKRLRTDAEGRFFFRARKLGDTGLTLLENGMEIQIPSADRAEADEPR